MLETRSFETMVNDTCQRIIDSDVGITNVSIGSVTRTLIEAILSELDVVQFVVFQAYLAKTIDDAEDDDLDDVVSILSVVRKAATKCTGIVTFSINEVSDIDIEIPEGSVVSTTHTVGGKIYEFEVAADSVLKAGELEVDVEVIGVNGGHAYLPPNSVRTINDSIPGIAEVTNKVEIVGGTDRETDEELRDRAKQALVKMGRGTCDSIKAAVSEIDGVTYCNVYDMRSGVGTVDVFIATEKQPTPPEILDEVRRIAEETKAAGIKVNILTPVVKMISISVEIKSRIQYEPRDIYDTIYQYINNFTIGRSLILNQLERLVLNKLNDPDADVVFSEPTANVLLNEDEILRSSSVTVDGTDYGVIENEEDNQQNN